MDSTQALLETEFFQWLNSEPQIRMRYISEPIVHRWLQHAKTGDISITRALSEIVNDLVCDNERLKREILKYVKLGASLPVVPQPEA